MIQRKNVLACMLVAILLCGCCKEPVDYKYRNRGEPIESVELQYFPYHVNRKADTDLYLHIRMLNEEEIEPFMNSMYELPVGLIVFGEGVMGGIGEYVVVVKYKNGVTEYFGSDIVGTNDPKRLKGGYYYVGDAFDELVKEYAGDISYLTVDYKTE